MHTTLLAEDARVYFTRMLGHPINKLVRTTRFAFSSSRSYQQFIRLYDVSGGEKRSPISRPARRNNCCPDELQQQMQGTSPEEMEQGTWTSSKANRSGLICDVAILGGVCMRRAAEVIRDTSKHESTSLRVARDSDAHDAERRRIEPLFSLGPGQGNNSRLLIGGGEKSKVKTSG